MKISDSVFWILSILIVISSYFIAQIDPLVQMLFGGYYGFIIGSFMIVNPAFVYVFLACLYEIFGKKYLGFYVQFFVNTHLIWLEVIPAFYLNQFYDIKHIIIGFCVLDLVLALYLCGYIRKWADKKLK